MARDAVYTLLADDTELKTLGGTGWVIEPNFTGDQRPNDAGAFAILRWGVEDFDKGLEGPHHFDVWVHLPVALSTDYVRIDNIIDRIDAILDAANDVNTVGADGATLNGILPAGRGPDTKDQGYQTICRRASYMAYSCPTS